METRSTEDGESAEARPVRRGKARGAVRDVQRAECGLTDTELVASLRGGDVAAWAEFQHRFRPLMQFYAARTRIPRSEWPACIEEVLEDAAMKLVAGNAAPPSHLSRYLVQAVNNRYLRTRRSESRLKNRYVAIAEQGPAGGGPRVVRTVCSEATVRSSNGGSDAGARTTGAIDRFALLLTKPLSEQEKRMLAWAGEQVPRREIAEWLGTGYEATKRRMSRLAARLRDGWPAVMGELTPEDRREVMRFLRRAGMPLHAGTSGEHASNDEVSSDEY